MTRTSMDLIARSASADPLRNRQRPGSSYFQALLRLIALAAYAAAIHYAYRDIFAVTFGYLRYEYTDPGISWIIAGYLIAAIPCLMLPRSISRPSDLVLWVLFLFVVVPTCQVPIYGSIIDRDTAVTFAVFVAVVFCAIIWLTSYRSLRLMPVVSTATNRPLIIFIALFSLLTYWVVISTFGFNIDLMSFLEVYDTRLEYRDQIAPSVPILGYLVSNQGNAINPLIITWAASRRRWDALAAAVLGQILLYSATGYKTLALSIPLCILVGFLLPRIRRIDATLLMSTVAVAAWLSIALRDEFTGLVELVMNRTIIVPAHITAAYVAIYTDAPKAMWSHSFLSPFVEDSYGLPPGLWVGHLFYGREDVNANASLFADGYANFGFVGIIIEAAVLAVLLIVLNSAARGLPAPLIIGAVAIPAFSTANGSPFSAILSYGVAMAALLFMLNPRGRAVPVRSDGDAKSI